MYKVGKESFNTFQAVVDWAYNTHKIDVSPLHDEREWDEETKQRACLELQFLTAEGGIEPV